MRIPLCIGLILLSILIPIQVLAVQFWTDPAGNDANPGTKALPFATLARAKTAVRTSLAAGIRGIIIVNVHGGTYRMDSPLQFGLLDTAKGAKVIYRAVKGETPVLTGSIPVTNWVLDAGRVYKSDLSAIALKPSRQLFVNGNRAPRARTPDYPSSFKPLFALVGSAWTTPGIEYLPNPILNPTIPDPFTWQQQDKIEAVIITQWKMAICRLDSISASVGIIPGLITMQEPGWTNANVFRDKDTGEPSIWSFWQVTRFENAREFLDEPGEWYLDETAKVLYYMPLWGEDIAAAEVELPQIESLIEITGAPGNPVSNIVFQGLTFRGATWNGPGSAEGYVADQSGFHLAGVHEPNYIGHVKEVVRTPGNISLTHASKIEFRGNTFEQLGAVAIDLVTGCVQNTIDKNMFLDNSSAAVQIGGVNLDDARPAAISSICRGNIVSNNRIYRSGQDYLDSAAIYAGFTQKTLITHNTIIDVPWSGIAIGWGWGLMDEGSFPGLPGANIGQWGDFNTPTISSNNKITYNKITGFLNMLWDGGAIYTNGQQGPTMAAGTTLSGNVAYGKRTLAGGNTYYTDGGSRYLNLRYNVSYDNPVGITYFGPSPNPLDLLPYPDVAILNGFPYGSDIGGCRPYGDIKYISNYLLHPDFFSVSPYVDRAGVTYPVDMEYRANRTITGVAGVPKGYLLRAGSSLDK
ncbi:MAG: right-handed parallel beta-helix repeat-containing protein [Victivallales bacterium]